MGRCLLALENNLKIIGTAPRNNCIMTVTSFVGKLHSGVVAIITAREQYECYRRTVLYSKVRGDLITASSGS